MKNILAGLIAIFALFAQPAQAEFTGNFNGVYVTLYETPCVSENVLEHLKPEFHSKFKQGKVAQDGKEFALCWSNDKELLKMAEIGPGEIFVVDEMRRFGGLPIEIFGRENQNKI